MSANYYDNIIAAIKKLIAVDLKKAQLILDKEFDVPYIPWEYEVELIALKNQIKLIIAEKRVINLELSTSEVFEILKVDSSSRVEQALSKLNQLNLKSFLADLQDIFASGQNNVIKAVVFESLAAQKINHYFKIDALSLNPSIDLGIADQPNFNDAISLIEKTIIKNPSLKLIALKLLYQYALKLFPNKITDPNEAKIIIRLAKELNGLKVKDLTDQKKNIIEKLIFKSG